MHAERVAKLIWHAGGAVAELHHAMINERVENKPALSQKYTIYYIYTHIHIHICICIESSTA